MFESKVNIYCGDSKDILKQFPDNSVDCCITSPPYYGLRDYGVKGQLGLEKTPEEYVIKLVDCFKEVKRVLKNEGTLWLNLGDSYAGRQVAGDKKFGNEEFNKNRPSRERTLTPERKRVSWLEPKNLIGIPWKVAFALQTDGWILRQDIIWNKTNPMPESVRDRCTKSHEYIFLLSKSPKYYFDYKKMQEPTKDINTKPRKFRKSGIAECLRNDTGNEYIPRLMRNKRSVWTVSTKPFKGSHFATFPEDLIKPCVLAGCPEAGVVLDPFAGAGTSGVVALKNNRKFVGIELNQKYIDEIIIPRLKTIKES